IAYGTGSLLFLILFFAHYAGYDLPLGLPREVIFLTAGGVLIVAALGAARTDVATPRFAFAGAMGGLLLALLPLARPVLFPVAPPPAPGHPVLTRIVSLNLHQGFDELGGWSFDRQMKELRESRPHIVALQEVSRGWVINGCADLFELTRESLGMPGEAGPSVRRDWGNAVFARHQLAAFENVPLPPDSLPIPRAVSVADARLAGGTRLRVFATHLHHPDADTTVRDRQAEAIAELTIPPDFRGGVLLGDFNALPDSRCFGILHEAGWTDIYQQSLLAEVGEGMTFPSAAPERRIDTILYRGPWRVAASGVAPPWGSDHRAVWVDLSPMGAADLAP
ncbi:MAG: hypothetical protein HKN12_07000, partial [Gemmatimonadetes bacterium]|nr:hypothetical protein [Gemmatimonadota bacterium]